MTVSYPEIAALVPHAGEMVLLERIVHWDDDSVHCRTTGHRNPRNPLRRDGILPAVCAIEYGAQAAAVHGGLLETSGAGYLAAVRNLACTVKRLDDIDAEFIDVRAQRRMADANAMIYDFRLSAEDRDETRLAEGQITIVLTQEHGG